MPLIGGGLPEQSNSRTIKSLHNRIQIKNSVAIHLCKYS